MRDALVDGIGSAIEIEHCAGGGGDRVVVGGLAGTGEDRPEGPCVFFTVAAGEVGELVAGDAEVLRGELVVANGAVAKLPDLGGAVDGNLIGTRAVDDERARAAKILEYFSDELALLGIGDAHDLELWAARAEQRTHGVEEG